MDHHFMIYHIAQGDPDDMANDAFHEAENDSLMKHKEYKLPIVHSLDELSEKIMLFEGGFDDRIMELAKAAAMAQAQSQYADFPITSSHLVQDGSDVQLILLDKLQILVDTLQPQIDRLRFEVLHQIPFVSQKVLPVNLFVLRIEVLHRPHIRSDGILSQV